MRTWNWHPNRYLVAAAAVAAAIALRLLFAAHLGDRAPYMLLFAAVMAASAYGGVRAGLFATIAGGIAGYFLFALQTNASIELILFLFEGTLLSVLASALHRARARVEASDQATRQLEQRILEISDDERRRIGHDLHDGLGQHLTGIALISKSLMQQLGEANPLSDQAATIAQMVRESIGWTRDLARGLSPVTLETDGLKAAMEEMAVNSSRLLNVQCDFVCDDETADVDGQTALHLYRIVQEAVNNSVRHGKAKSVRIDLSTSGGKIILKVMDDGSGLSAKTLAHPGLGLQIMNYRARMIGAELEVMRGDESGGTIVTCRIPAQVNANPIGRQSHDVLRDDLDASQTPRASGG